jgi:hypothetical protein
MIPRIFHVPLLKYIDVPTPAQPGRRGFNSSCITEAPQEKPASDIATLRSVQKRGTSPIFKRSSTDDAKKKENLVLSCPAWNRNTADQGSVAQGKMVCPGRIAHPENDCGADKSILWPLTLLASYNLIWDVRILTGYRSLLSRSPLWEVTGQCWT